MHRILAFLSLGLALSACAMGDVETRRRHAPVMRSMPDLFDCLRVNRLALVSAHRGQKNPLAAENSLSSFAETIERGPILIEIDVARSADGVLMLMHDSTLDRTTTGSGPLAAKTYPQLRQFWLKDGRGRITPERIPTLEEALIWARRNGAALQLDLKPGVPLAGVLALVRENRMENQVILIAYNLADTRAALARAPDMMISAGIRQSDELPALLRLAGPRILFFTGTQEPDAALVARLDEVQIEAITGTLGAPGKRLDDRYLADGDGREYADLAARGVALIATDQPLEAWRALKSARRDGTPCLKGEGN